MSARGASDRRSTPRPGYPDSVSAARRRAKPRSRVGVWAVALGIPAGLAGLAVGLAVVSPSGGSPAGAATPAASAPAPDALPAPGTSSAAGSAAPSPAASASTGSATLGTPSAEPSASAPATTPTGPSGRSDANRANPGLEVIQRVETDDPVFFITVDDNVNDRSVAEAGLAIIQANRIPITAFLASNYVANDTEYFEAATAYGGSVQNHTVTHPNFATTNADPYTELCGASEALEEQFGYRSWMFRPPFGEPYYTGDPTALESAALQCGINRIVRWSAVMHENEVSYTFGGTLSPGDVVLFHFWDPYFAEGLQQILDIGRANGLTPAPLEDYL